MHGRDHPPLELDLRWTSDHTRGVSRLLPWCGSCVRSDVVEPFATRRANAPLGYQGLVAGFRSASELPLPSDCWPAGFPRNRQASSPPDPV